MAFAAPERAAAAETLGRFALALREVAAPGDQLLPLRNSNSKFLQHEHLPAKIDFRLEVVAPADVALPATLSGNMLIGAKCARAQRTAAYLATCQRRRRIKELGRFLGRLKSNFFT